MASDPGIAPGPTCTKCGNAKHHTGSRWRCSTCYNAWQTAWKATRTPQQKAAANRRQTEIRRARPEHQKEAQREYVRRWRAENQETYLAGSRDWYARNAESARAAKLAEYRADKPAFVARNMRRKARIREAICSHGNECVDRKFLAELYAQPCFYCGADTTDADHFQPLAGGGLHCRDNLVPACEPCNASKHARNPVEFLTGVRGDQ